MAKARVCWGEDITVYEAYGKTCPKALKNLAKILENHDVDMVAGINISFSLEDLEWSIVAFC